MKQICYIIIGLVTLLSPISLYGQLSDVEKLITEFYFTDTIIFQIDSNVFDNTSWRFNSCPEIKPEFVSTFHNFSAFDAMKREPYRLHSVKRLDDQLIVMTIIGYGKYNPMLYLLCFKSERLTDEFLLQSFFVDAGQVDIYSSKQINARKFVRSYYTESDQLKEGKSFTVTDSTAVIFQISDEGKIDTLEVEKFQNEIEWK